MNIEKQFDDFKTWVDNLGLLLVEADFEEKKSPIVDIPSSDDNSLSTFQKVVEKIQSKIIVCETLRFDKAKFNIYQTAIAKIDDSDIQEKFERLRHYEDKFLGYALMAFSEGMTFRFSKYIKELDDYLEIESAALDYIEDGGSEDSKYKEIPQEKVIELGRQLAEHENYSKLKSRTQRENFSRELFKSEFENLSVHDFYGATVIVSYAETYYETKIKPQKEKELKNKITELLNKGWTKVKIAAELGISKDTLNKYI